jgi:hypothetical protein
MMENRDAGGGSGKAGYHIGAARRRSANLDVFSRQT